MHGDLLQFVIDFWTKVHTERNEQQLWEFWLHKVDEAGSFEDFKNKIMRPQVETPKQSAEKTASAIETSRNILSSINPTH